MKYTFKLIIVIAIAIASCTGRNNQKSEVAEIIPPEPVVMYDLVVDSFNVIQGTVRPNQFLADLLSGYNVDYAVIDNLARNYRHVFDVRRIKAGNPYTLLCAPDSLLTAQYFIYEIDYTEYVVFGT